MKKHIVAAFLAIVMCVAMLSGCSLVKGFERDVQVVLKVNGEYQGCYTVNTFNNAIVPVPEAPQGLMFYGWTADESWEEKGAANVAVSANKGLIRYDDVKDWIVNDELSVTLYPVFGEIPRHDIAIAWYGKTVTSGLDKGFIDGFTVKLNEYLVSQSYDPSSMDIVIREYVGNVGPTCDAIKSDGDIDIMIGWYTCENLTTTGGLVAGVDFLENNINIRYNPDFKPNEEQGRRSATKISDTEICNLVYQWIIETYKGEDGAICDYKFDGTVEPEPEPPVDPDPPVPTDKITVTDKVLNVSIWNNSKGAWINNEQIEKLKADFKAHIDECVTNAAEVTLNWIVEPDVTDVATLAASVTAAGNIDFVVGCGGNVDTNEKGHLDNLVKCKVEASPYMAANRYVAVLHKDSPNQLAKILYKFMTGQEFKIKVTDTTLNVSIWNNSKGAWINNEQIEKLKTDFAEHINKNVSNASSVTINWIVEPDVTDVATLSASVTAAGNIDFVVGCGGNVDTNEKGHLDNLVKCKVEASAYMAANRYVALLHKDTPNQLAVMLYEFMTGSAFTVAA